MDSSLLVSALAGAVGALILRSILRLAGRQWSSFIPVARYSCAEDGKYPGFFRHGWGQQEILRDGRAVWSHTNRQIQEGVEHTLYGPYINDFGRPGYYRVQFRLSGSGFDKNSNKSVVVLDVTQAPFGDTSDKKYFLHGQKIIRAKDLSSNFKTYDVVCYITGAGVFEYRASVVKEEFNEGKSIYFYDVRIYRFYPLWEILS